MMLFLFKSKWRPAFVIKVSEINYRMGFYSYFINKFNRLKALAKGLRTTAPSFCHIVVRYFGHLRTHFPII